MRIDARMLEHQIAERNAKIDALHEKLTTAVESLITDEDWRRVMEFAARFRSRSFNNTLLIYVQHYAAFEAGRVPEPTPTYLAGFSQWHRLGRTVMKGQAGYQILAPVTARMASSTPGDPSSWHRLGRGEKPEAGEVVRSRMIGVKPGYVWDISMTQGPTVAQLPAPKLLTGQAPPGLWDGLADQITANGFELRLVSNAAAIGGAHGLSDYLTREVSVRMDMDDAAQTRTLAHELGHIVLHDPDNVDAAVHRGIAEVEAESVALMITAAHGMDSSQYTIPYVSTWAARVRGQDPVQTVQNTGARVRAAALGILDRLDTITVPDGNPPGLERSPARATAIEPVSPSPTPQVEGVSL